MEMVILLSETQVKTSDDDYASNEEQPMCDCGVRTSIDETQVDAQLQTSENKRYGNVVHLQFVCHELESMLTVRLTNILVQHDTVADCCHTINAIDNEEYQPSRIHCFHDYAAYHKEHDESRTQ